MDTYYRQLIADEFRNCVNRTIDRIIHSERSYRPFHTALLSDEVVFWSAFERSFSTSFGQRVIEEIARLVALSNGADYAKRQVETFIKIDTAYEEAIHEEVRILRDRNRCMEYSWNHTLQRVMNTQPSGTTVNIRVISDLWWYKGGVNNYISLKTTKPNIDQTVIAKEDCLHLAIADPSCNTYFGLPYNPYGELKENYSHKPPMGIFDFKHDHIVLIGKEMWDTIGGDYCYEELLEIATEVGEETKKIIMNLGSRL